MKFATLIGIGFLSCVGLLSGAGAADFVPADEPIVQMPIGTEARTYYREHRLRAYEKTRASTTQGATCVTPKLVCWIDESVMGGDPCACETSHFGVVPGTVGG